MYCFYNDAIQINCQFQALQKRSQKQEKAVFMVPDHLDLDTFNDNSLKGAWMSREDCHSQVVVDLRHSGCSQNPNQTTFKKHLDIWADKPFIQTAELLDYAGEPNATIHYLPKFGIIAQVTSGEGRTTFNFFDSTSFQRLHEYTREHGDLFASVVMAAEMKEISCKL